MRLRPWTLGAALLACCSGPVSSSPCNQVMGQDGHAQVAVCGPSPVVRGNLTLDLLITDATNGAALDGVIITLVPWMPSMGHGASVTPQVSAAGNGHYTVTNLVLVMPGTWQLRTELSGTVTDTLVATLTVE
jgi:YtkA-like